ncbi:MAG: ATP-binding protein [Candidatus Acidiferrales bacterium]
MSRQPRRVDVTLDSKVESIDLGEELARQVAGSAGFDDDEQYKISMAVRECVINALKHGNRGDESKQVRLNFSLQPDRLVVQVGDQGSGFDLEEVPDPLANENLLRSSGRGLFLVRCFMDELRVGPGEAGGATVTMAKKYSSNHNNSAESNVEKEKKR